MKDPRELTHFDDTRCKTYTRRKKLQDCERRRLWDWYRESRRYSRDTYPQLYITKYGSIRGETRGCGWVQADWRLLDDMGRLALHWAADAPPPSAARHPLRRELVS
jgi:hypothetical protein